MGTPLKVHQHHQILTLEVKKAGKKRLEFFKIGGVGGLIGRPDERLLVGQSSNKAGHYHPPIRTGQHLQRCVYGGRDSGDMKFKK